MPLKGGKYPSKGFEKNIARAKKFQKKLKSSPLSPKGKVKAHVRKTKTGKIARVGEFKRGQRVLIGPGKVAGIYHGKAHPKQVSSRLKGKEAHEIKFGEQAMYHVPTGRIHTPGSRASEDPEHIHRWGITEKSKQKRFHAGTKIGSKKLRFRRDLIPGTPGYRHTPGNAGTLDSAFTGGVSSAQGRTT